MIAVFKFRCLVNANVSVSTKIHIDDTPIPIRLQGVNRKGIKIGNVFTTDYYSIFYR